MKGIKLTPARIITCGFAGVILVGAILLWLPITHQDGAIVSFVDAFFTSTSAVCVTGLIAIDTAEHFNVFGRFVVAALIQIGGLGVTCAGAAFILMGQKRMGLHQRILIREGLNLHTLSGAAALVKSVLKLTLLFEGVGFLLSLIVFAQDFPFDKAIGIAAFHSVAAFNNSGFDILGGLTNLIPYQQNFLLNLTTCFLIIFGGLGFVVIMEIAQKRRWKHLSINSKIVLMMSAFLLIIGTLLLKFTENVTWLGAFFQSTSARTAGFSTYPIGTFTSSGLFVLIILMFIGASPGSTGGGIKTTTTFAIGIYIRSLMSSKHRTAFHRRISEESILKAFALLVLAMMSIGVCTWLITIADSNFSFMQIFFETVSAFGTVGLSTGITPHLHDFSKLVLCAMMFIGRLGPLTIACIWSAKASKKEIRFAEEAITIG